MYVCNCNAITDREIRAAASLGDVTFDDLRRDLGVATCCGKCEPAARALLHASASVHCSGHCESCGAD